MSTTTKKSARRVYRVNDHLVRAATQSAAVHHVVRETFSVRVATQDDIASLVSMGMPIQDASEDWKPVRKDLTGPGLEGLQHQDTQTNAPTGAP